MPENDKTHPEASNELYKFSAQFYYYNTNKLRLNPLKVGDTIKAIEFNQTTQLYDIAI